MDNNIIHFETLGCRLNQDESEGAARCFSNAGFVSHMESATAKTQPDPNVYLCIINTCTVTGKAEQKARRIMRLLLEKYPLSPLVVTGCYAELDRTEITEICPQRIVILPGTKKYALAKLAQDLKEYKASNPHAPLEKSTVEKYLEPFMATVDSMPDQAPSSGAKLPSVAQRSAAIPQKKELDLNSFTLYTPVFEKHSRASIKVQDGCNNQCAYCRIHLARGKAISLAVEEVVNRVQLLEQTGMNEVVFTGVNLSQYSAVMEDGTTADFKKLLQVLLDSTSTIKFRISSFYPQHITEELCQVLKNPRIQPSFHLSLQSGSDSILKAMRRPYKRDAVIQAVKLLRQAKKDPFISCDIIAGFPGETQEDFQQTMDLCDQCDFGWIHAFPFSPRPGTPAYTMKPQIPERIKGERVKWLTQKAIQGKLAYINRWQKEKVTAIVENSRSQRTSSGNQMGQQIIHAVTQNFLHVECPVLDASQYPQGTLLTVRIGPALEQNIISGREVECTASLCGSDLFVS